MVTFLFGTMTVPSFAEDYSCLQSPDLNSSEPDWRTSGDKDLKFVVSWAFKDPENCIVGIDPSWDYKFRFPKQIGAGNYFDFPATWKVSRAGEMALVSAETEFPVALLQSLNHIDNSESNYNFSQLGKGRYTISANLKIKRAGGYVTQSIDGDYGFPQLWGHWFSKNQGIYPNQCNPEQIKSAIKTNWKIIEVGIKPKLEISLSQENNCIFLVHAGPLESYKVESFVYPARLTQAEYPYWAGPGTVYFKSILSKPNEIIQIGVGNFIEVNTGWDSNSVSNYGYVGVARIPAEVLTHEDLIELNNNVIKINTTIDGSKLDSTSTDLVTVLLGVYSWRYDSPSYTPSNWSITFSGNSWTAQYRKGGSSAPGTRMSYENIAIKIPVADLFTSPEVKAAAALKAKQEADAKAAADLKAKQEAVAKAVALEADRLAQQKQSCLQHNIDVQNLRKKLTTLKNDFYSLNSKEEFDCDKYGNPSLSNNEYFFSRTKELWDKQMSIDLLVIANYEKEALSVKKTTITCIKGKLTKKVTAVKPKCPAGYKKK